MITENMIISEWKPLSKFPSSSSVQEELDTANSPFAVYQFAEKTDIDEIGQEFIHPKIGYTGYSKKAHSRIYKARQCANPSSTTSGHGAGSYIRKNKKLEDIFVRIVFCPDDKSARSLEKYIHDETTVLYGSKYCWVQASAGKDGNFDRVTDMLSAMTVAELKDIMKFCEGQVKDKLFEEFMSEDE